MSEHRILYTRHDGGVNICIPQAAILRVMEGGGGWYEPSAHVNGLHDDMGNSVSAKMKYMIDRKVENGGQPEVASRFVKAMAEGGCTTAEALDIIRAKDCEPYGVAFELTTFEALPDRWFRAAWRRSKDGGEIFVDMSTAMHIQAQKIEAALRKVNKQRTTSDNFASRFVIKSDLKPIELDWDGIEAAIRGAQTPSELRAIWPAELS